MVAQTELAQRAKEAATTHKKILKGLEEYYTSDITFGYVAEMVGVPLRALIDFMQYHGLPYVSGRRDMREGLRKVRKLLAETTPS